MARIAAKLWQNTFQTIYKFSFFDTEFFFAKQIWRLNFSFEKMAFWRRYKFPSVTGRQLVKSCCLKCPYFGEDFLGEGANNSICVLDHDLGPKLTETI